MNYSEGYVPYLVQAKHGIAMTLGTDIMGVDTQTYNVDLMNNVLFGMVMKAIQDLSPTIATDAWWQQRLNIAIDTGPNGDRSGWPGWVIMQITPESLAMYGATTSDSVATLQAKIAAYNAGGSSPSVTR